jgi:SPP1 gp7 family putative phage head morphogenesis protein
MALPNLSNIAPGSRSLVPSPAEKQVGHGDAQVSYGNGEKPQYRALRQAINDYYADLLRPLAVLRDACFAALPFADPQKDPSEQPFRYTTPSRRVIDRAVELFLEEMAGPDRSREGFIEGGIAADAADGILQQRNLFSFAVGVQRGADLLSADPSLATARESPAVRQMLDHAFDRLSANGALRLEGVRDDIHSVLVSATDAGLNPLATARQLAGQFDQYAGWEFQRLARTEAAYAAEEGTRGQLADLGVERVEVVIAAGACPICQAYDGQVFEIGDEENLPPFHPNCLCSTAPAAPERGQGFGF